MNVLNLHHLAVPCIAGIREVDNSLCQENTIYYLNPRAIVRYEPGGAVISPPMLYSSFLFADEEMTILFKQKSFSGRGISTAILSILLENEVILRKPILNQPFLETQVTSNGLPTQVLFEVTSFCNCDCITCYHKSDLNHYVPPLDNLLERIAKLKELGVGVFEVTGGEPFSRNDFCQILDYINQLGMHFYVATNGEYLSNSSPELIKVLKKSLGLAVSLDGVGEIHNSVRRRAGLYDKMIKGLDYVHSLGIKIYFISTLNKKNLNCAQEMITVAKHYNTTVHFRPTIKTGAAVFNNLEQIDLAKELKKLLNHPNVRNGLLNTKKMIPRARYYGCGLRKRISVDSHGMVYPCVMDRSSFLSNINDYTQASLVYELEEETKRFLITHEYCRKCIHNKNSIHCGGFCRFSNSYKNNIGENYGK